MTREEKVLGLVDKKKIGLEIEPSFSPFAAKKNGFKVHIIDHMNKQQLIEKYTPHNINLDAIEEVDFVWHGESYAALTGNKNYYQWIIASHLIEHTPDLISFLKQCEEVLTDDGVLSLVIPDVRYHFDYFRPITGISKVIDAYYNKNTIHTAGTAAEYFLNFSKRGGTICWNEGFKGELALEFTKADAEGHMQTVIQQNAYLDLHAWSFTPTSFRLMIQDLNDLGFISLREVAYYPSSGCEFYITLCKKGIGFLDHRMDALKTIKAELSL